MAKIKGQTRSEIAAELLDGKRSYSHMMVKENLWLIISTKRANIKRSTIGKV